MPLIFEGVYSFDTGQTGLAFWSLVVGAFLALAANRCDSLRGIGGGLFLLPDIKSTSTQSTVSTGVYNCVSLLIKQAVPVYGPEARLFYSCVGGIVFVFGGIIVSFAQGRTHWIVVCIGFVLIQFGQSGSGLPTGSHWSAGIFKIYISVFSCAFWLCLSFSSRLMFIVRSCGCL
jgi:hypothetical protein